MAKHSFVGVIAAVVTPFQTDGTIDLDRLDQHLGWLIDQGVHGVMLTGTAGEYANLSLQERQQVASRAVIAVRRRVPVIVHASHMNRECMLELIRQAEQAGADAVMLTPPSIVRPTQGEIEAYFREAASAVSTDVVIYNNPSRVGVNIAADTLIHLSEVRNIVALKDSGREMRDTTDIVNEVGDQLAVLTGESDLFLPTLALGGTGGILTMPNIAPKLHAELFESFQRGDLKQAHLLNKKLMDLSRALSSEGKYHAAIKAAMRQLGIPIGMPRSPLTDVSDDAKATIQEQLEILDLLPA